LEGIVGENNWYTSDVTITLQAEDDYSEILTTYYMVDENNWNIQGHSHRIVPITKTELELSAKLYDEEGKELLLMLLDLARRIGKFDAAVGIIEKLREYKSDESVLRFVKFQKHLIRYRNTGGYFFSNLDKFQEKLKKDNKKELLEKAIKVLQKLNSGKSVPYVSEFIVLNEISYLLRLEEIPLTDENFELLLQLVSEIVKAHRSGFPEWVWKNKDLFLDCLRRKFLLSPAEIDYYKNLECIYWNVDNAEEDYYSTIEPTASISGLLATLFVKVPCILKIHLQVEELLDRSSFFLSMLYPNLAGDTFAPLGNTPEKFREMIAV
jgi:tetratricopeptide (TPR) repeat protein